MRWRVLLLLTTTIILSSCGFQLRGTETISPALQDIYIKTNDPYGQLTRNLQRYLHTSGIHVASSPDDAKYVLNILNEQQREDLISVSGTLQTRQYNLVLVVNFELTKPNGNVIIASQTVNETRFFTLQSDQTLGGSNEEASMFQQMREDIVPAILNRLSSQDLAPLLKGH